MSATTDLPLSFTDRIRQTIRDSGWTRYRLAQASNGRLHQSELSRFLSGRGNLGLRKINVIAELVGMEVSLNATAEQCPSLLSEELAEVGARAEHLLGENQRLRQIHVDSQSEELQAAQAEINALRRECDQLRTDRQVLSQTTERLRQFAAAVQDAKRINRTLNCGLSAAAIEAALERLETVGPTPPALTKVKYKMCGDRIWDVEITAVAEPLNDSTGTDGPGQS